MTYRGASSSMSLTDKVKLIFDRFDIDGDGKLSRVELSLFIQAVNPKSEFTSMQLEGVLQEVRNICEQFIDEKGNLSMEGLTHAYREEFADIDDDLATLGLPKTLTDEQIRKVRKIFDAFDGDKDGHMSMLELKQLVKAVNPPVDFEESQMQAIVNVVCEKYSQYVSDKGLSYEGLKQTYVDGAGDPDRDFEILKLSLHDDDEIGLPTFPVYDKEEEVQKLLKEIRNRLESGSASPADADGCSTLIQSVAADLGLSPLDRSRAYVEVATCCNSRAAQTGGSNLQARDAWYQKAHAAGEQGRAIDRTNPNTHFILGNIVYAMGQAMVPGKDAMERCADAVHHFEDALKNTNDDDGHKRAKIFANLGIACESSGLVLNACEHYKQAALRAPSSFRALKLYGSALFALGQSEDAKHHLVHALMRAKEASFVFAEAQCDLGCVLADLGDYQEALQTLKEGCNAAPPATEMHIVANFNLGNVYREQASKASDEALYESAIDCYSNVITGMQQMGTGSHHPLYWQTCLNKGIALLGANRLSEAETYLKNALSISQRVDVYDTLKAVSRKSKSGQAALLSKVLRNGGYTPMRFKGSVGKADQKRLAKTGFTLDQLSDKLDFTMLASLAPVAKRLTVQALEDLYRRGPLKDMQTTSKLHMEKVLRSMGGTHGPDTLAKLPTLSFAHSMKILARNIFHLVDIKSLYSKPDPDFIAGDMDTGFTVGVLMFLAEEDQDTLLEKVWNTLCWRAKRKDTLPQGDLQTFIALVTAVYGQKHDHVAIINEGTERDYTWFKEQISSSEAGCPWALAVSVLGSRHGWVH